MKILNQLLFASIVLTFSVGSATAQHAYSKAVQKACANDYHRHCPQYGIETEALRLCMDKAGQALSKTCVNALVGAGEVSKARLSVASVVVGDALRLREWPSRNPKRERHG
jgi:hypothetical protein